MAIVTILLINTCLDKELYNCLTEAESFLSCIFKLISTQIQTK